MKIFKKLTCLGLACLLVLGAAPLGAAAQTSIPIGTSTTAPTPLGLSMTPFALGDYDPSDVAVINKIITDNGLVATYSDPDNWVFATWDGSNPKRLTKLSLQGKNLNGHLDVSGLTGLTTLYCRNNQLTSLTVTDLPNLTGLYCYNNQLTSLTVTDLPSLTTLDCYNNQLTSLEVSGLTSLTLLYCSNNQLTSLTVTDLTSLAGLDCSYNQLTSLTVTDLTSLAGLDCSYNQLTSLTVADLTSLTTLDCGSNQLTSLDVSELTNLTTLYCYNNQLTSLTVSGLPSLRTLNCRNNQLTSLEVRGLTSLTTLDCYSNQLTSLEVSGLASLEELDCRNNQLTSLTVTDLTSLITLNCNSNQLTSLTVSGLTSLITLDCSSNQLTSLDVSELTNLTTLRCYNNQLTSLDVSGLTSLARLYCRYNYMPNQAAVNGIGGVGTVGFDPQNSTGFLGVTGINNLPNKMAVGFPLMLEGNVFPTNAANQTIVWSVASGGTTGATITENSLTATDQGTASIKATIADGFAPTADYTQGFEIMVFPADRFFSPLVVDGGSGSGDYHAGKAVTITASPATGKVFKEWQTTPAVVFDSGTDKYSSTASFAMPASAVTATAMYENCYEVTLQTDGNGSVVASKTSAPAGESIDLTAIPSTGYRFKEWQVVSGGVTIVNNSFVMPNNPVTVKAIFELIPPSEYAITLQTGGNGSAVASKTSAPAGESIDLTAIPSTGYRFKEWQVVSGGVTIVNNSFVMPNNPVTVKAIFELIPPNEHAITVQTDGNGSAVASKTSALAGESIDLTATPSTGYRFKEWQVVSGGVTIVNNSFVMPNNPVIVKAIFEVQSTTPPVTGTTTSGGSSSEGGTTKADAAPVLANSRAFTKTDATKLFNMALAEKPESVTTLSIRARNYTSVDKGVLAELAAIAEKNGVTLTLHFDTVVSKAVTYRLSVNPAMVQTNLDLTAKIAGGKITLPKFGAPTKVAVKMPAGITLANLKITQNGKVVTDAKPWLDKNGYVHFTTTGGELVLSK